MLTIGWQCPKIIEIWKIWVSKFTKPWTNKKGSELNIFTNIWYIENTQEALIEYYQRIDTKLLVCPCNTSWKSGDVSYCYVSLRSVLDLLFRFLSFDAVGMVPFSPKREILLISVIKISYMMPGSDNVKSVSVYDIWLMLCQKIRVIIYYV